MKILQPENVPRCRRISCLTRFRADAWSFPAVDGAGNNVSIQLIDDMRRLKEMSNASDLLVTNRICETASPIDFDGCGPRYWYLSGYAERRVYFETYAYTMDNEYRSAENRVATISKFISTPNSKYQGALWNQGVRWIFIDKSRLYSDYSAFASLAIDSESSQIWELNTPE